MDLFPIPSFLPWGVWFWYRKRIRESCLLWRTLSHLIGSPSKCKGAKGNLFDFERKSERRIKESEVRGKDLKEWMMEAKKRIDVSSGIQAPLNFLLWQILGNERDSKSMIFLSLSWFIFPGATFPFDASRLKVWFRQKHEVAWQTQWSLITKWRTAVFSLADTIKQHSSQSEKKNKLQVEWYLCRV